MDYTLMPTDEIVRILNHSNRDFEEETFHGYDFVGLVKEIFKRGEEYKISREKLREVIFKTLPPFPANNDTSRKQRAIAYCIWECNMPIEMYDNVPLDRLLFHLTNSIKSNAPKAKEYSAEIFAKIQFLRKTDHVPDTVIYEFIRKQVPEVKDGNFYDIIRKVVELL